MLLRPARSQAGDALTGFEVIGRHALSLVARHFPQIPQPLPVCARRCCWNSRQRGRGPCAGPARGAAGARWTRARSATRRWRSRRCSHARCGSHKSRCRRRSRPRGSSSHDIGLPVSARSRVRGSGTGRRRARAGPACARSPSATWRRQPAPHVQAPEGEDPGPLPGRTGRRGQHVGARWCRQHRGTISPSTASAGSSATSCSGASRRWRWR